ncbi:hypothetical protein NQZ68_020457 [Dissostichus eleginoides]|nr:hypothetical protein NQZ68_020457 [Dissostichus eleginoides]
MQRIPVAHLCKLFTSEPLGVLRDPWVGRHHSVTTAAVEVIIKEELLFLMAFLVGPHSV